MTKSASEVVIESSVYGSLPVKAEQIIRFPKKLVGIPDYSEYALLQLDETAFYLLHALQDDFHFILIPAADVVRDYEFDLSSRNRGAAWDQKTDGSASFSDRQHY